jgi:hypothetical protein
MRAFLTVCAVLTLSLVIGLTQADAVSEALDDAKAQYPGIEGSRLDTCELCHIDTDSFELNPYGAAFNGAGMAFGAIENDDSDGDGFTNLEEIVALTFPGDAGDFPAGGGSRIVGRGSLATDSDVYALAAATDDDRDEVLVAWAGTAIEARAGGMVESWLVDDAGAPIKNSVTVAGSEVSEGHGIGAAYGKKRFIVTWTGSDDAAWAQLLKSKKGKLYKKALELGEAAANPVPGWDGKAGRFVVASEQGGGVGLDQVDTKGKVTRRSLGRFATHVIAEYDSAFSFVWGGFGDGVLLLAGAQAGKNVVPGAAAVEGGQATDLAEAVHKGNKKATQFLGTLPAGADAGLSVLRQGPKVTTLEIDPAQGFASKGVALKGAKAGAAGVAAQSDGTFLVVWVDAKKRTLLAVDRSADGKTTSDTFELQADGEKAAADVLAVVPLGDNVLVVYVVDGTPDTVRTVVVGPAE